FIGAYLIGHMLALERLEPADRESKKMKPLVPTPICWALLALFGTGCTAEKTMTYRAPRLPDGHADMQGMWKNSNLTPLERPSEFTQLAITAADATRFKALY